MVPGSARRGLRRHRDRDQQCPHQPRYDSFGAPPQPTGRTSAGLDDRPGRRGGAGGLAERIRPRLPTAIGHCVYIKRTALDLVGGFDTQFSPGYDEEVDFSQRCVARGLVHVAADDVLVAHEGGASFGRSPEVERLRLDHDNLIRARYPYYDQAAAAAAESDGALSRAIGVARRALVGISVTIDGACLGGPVTGTQIVVLEVIQALARSGAVRLRVAIPHRCGVEARRVLDRPRTRSR